MKKVLVITTDFPGSGGRGNFKLIKYLHKFGYDPIVISNKTRSNDMEKQVAAHELADSVEFYKTICINKSPFRIFSKFLGSWKTKVFFEKFFFFPDLYVTWVPSAFVKGMYLLKTNDISAIITASPPESIHVTGLLLKLFTGKKWIVDLRDLWTTKEIVYDPVSIAHDLLAQKLEKSIYHNADHIIANTYGNRDIYTSHFGIPNGKITVITNGFDKSEITELQHMGYKQTHEEFSIGYMGYFDKPGFPWQCFLESVKRLVKSDDNTKLKIHICGHVSSQAKDFIQQAGLSEHVVLYGVVTHREAMARMLPCDVLLLLMYETEYSNAIVPHKLYHYLGMGKHIFAIARPEGELADILRETNAGTVVSCTDGDAVFERLKLLYSSWKTEHSVDCVTSPEISKYEISHLCEKLAATIGKVSDG